MTPPTDRARPTEPASGPRLNRAALAAQDAAQASAAAAPPVRIVHVGLGAFHRAHQAWYTARASDGAQWGIAAFTGRSGAVAAALGPQDGLYTLLERSGSGDTVSIVASIVEAVDGADLTRFVDRVACADTAVVTLTVTEAGYRLTSTGEPDLSDDAVLADIAALADARPEAQPAVSPPAPTTALARLLLGLDARRRRGSGPIAVVPCDNMPHNGTLVRSGLLALAAHLDDDLGPWIETSVSFVSTSVDRITPATTEADVEAATRLSGWRDAYPVVTEPFSDWVLCGDFPAGRPAWESAGARFVDDIEPFERRKLWLLNGAHSLLAYAGRLKGHESVAQAIGDPELLAWVGDLWDEASRHLPAQTLGLDAYREALLSRFANARIEHRLEQIGRDGVTKLRLRVSEVIRRERAAGRTGHGGARALAAWVALLLRGDDLPDAQSPAITAALARGDGNSEDDHDIDLDHAGRDARVSRLLGVVDPVLARDEQFTATVSAALDAFPSPPLPQEHHSC